MDIKEVYLSIVSCFSAFGIFITTAFLILLFLGRKQRTVEGYTQAIAQNAILDLLLSIAGYLVKLDCVIFDGYAIYAVTAFTRELPRFTLSLLMMFGIATIQLSIFAMPIPFAVRYLIICRGKRLSTLNIATIYLIPALGIVFTQYCLLFGFKISPPELSTLQMKPYLLPNLEGRFWNFMAAKMSDPLIIALFVFVFCMTSGNFLATLFFNYKVLTTLKKKQFSELERKGLFDLQVTIIVQAVAQFSTLTLPLMLLVLLSFFGFKDTFYFLNMLEMAPAITTTSTMISVPLYRKKIKELIHTVYDNLV